MTVNQELQWSSRTQWRNKHFCKVCGAKFDVEGLGCGCTSRLAPLSKNIFEITVFRIWSKKQHFLLVVLNTTPNSYNIYDLFLCLTNMLPTVLRWTSWTLVVVGSSCQYLTIFPLSHNPTVDLSRPFLQVRRLFLFSSSQVTKVRNFSKFSSFGDLLWGVSDELLENKFLWLIPQKFLRNSLELVPIFRDF